MNNLFVYLEIENGIVQEVSLELLTKGRALATRLGCQLEAVAISNCIKGIAEQVFRFTVFAKPQAVVMTVALAASVLFASPLLPFCRKLFERCGAKCRHYFDRTR